MLTPHGHGKRKDVEVLENHSPQLRPYSLRHLHCVPAFARAGLSARSDSAITSLHMAAAIALESPQATPVGFGSRRNRG